MDNSNYNLKNVSEDLVDIYLLDCMEHSGMCTCKRCQADVKAYALNNFPAHYVVTDLGDALTRTRALSNQFQADMITAISKGIMIVKDKPRHNL